MADTPYMSLELPVPTVTIGPDYAEQNNAAFTLVDSHTHVPGQGLPVPSAGLNIDADLPFNSLNATLLRSSRFVSQASPLAEVTDLACLYTVDGELYYNDVLGNQVRITVSGAVDSSGSGSISGMGATTAAATYAAINSTFSFTSDTNTPAKLNVGPITVGRNAANPFTVTISPSASQASNYNLTLPIALPAATSLMVCDSSGQLSAPYTFDNSTVEVSANQVQLKALGVSTAKIAAGAVTRAKLASVGEQSSELVNFSTSSTSFVAVTDATVTLTNTAGRPNIISFQPAGSTAASIQVSRAGATVDAEISIYRDGAAHRTWGIQIFDSVATSQILQLPGNMMIVDQTSATTHTYAVYVRVLTGGATITITEFELVAYEL